MARVSGAPGDVIPTDGAERSAGIEALALSIFNAAQADGAPITMAEARQLASQQAAAVPAKTEPTLAPDAELPVAEEQEPFSVLATQPTAQQQQLAAYSAHRSRVKRLAEQAGVSYDEADSMLQSGYGEAGIGFSPGNSLDGGGAGGLPSPTQLAVAMDKSGLTGQAFDRRMADQRQREENVRRSRMLAGPSAAANAVNLFNTLPPDWQNVVAAGRLTPNLTQTGVTPLGAQVGEQRIRELQAEIQARASEGEANRDQQWRQFQATADAAADQRDILRQQFEAEQAARMAAIEQNAAKMNADLQLSLDNTQAQKEIAAARNETEIKTEGMRNPPLEDRMNAALQGKQLESRQTTQQGDPGLYNLMVGLSDSPEAKKLLQDLAAQADVTHGGFGDESIAAMDDALRALAYRAVAMGITDTPLLDVNERARLISRHGTASGWKGGRGSTLGNWLSGGGKPVDPRRLQDGQRPPQPTAAR